MQNIDWLSLALGFALFVTGLWLAIRFREDERDANIHYIYTLAFALGVGFLAAFIPGALGVDTDLTGLTIRASGGLGAFVLTVVIFYFLQTRRAIARVREYAALRTRRSAGVMSDCSTVPNCNNDPVVICTSLPNTIGSPFDLGCRDLTEVLCLAVVRYMEEYNRTKNAAGGATLPAELNDWKQWAKGLSGKPGLPGCLDLSVVTRTLGNSMWVDLSTVSPATPDNLAAARYTNRISTAIESFGSDVMSFNIDDWHDE